MANQIKYINEVSANRFLDGYSRYRNSNVIYYGTPPRIAFTTYKKSPISFNVNDNFGVIPPGAEYRPDKISQKMYGSPDFWWKILEANNMKDIYEFKAGLTIRLPINIL